jgi:hypothetical protein
MLMRNASSLASPRTASASPFSPVLSVREREARLAKIINLLRIIREHEDFWFFYQKRLMQVRFLLP